MPAAFQWLVGTVAFAALTEASLDRQRPLPELDMERRWPGARFAVLWSAWMMTELIIPLCCMTLSVYCAGWFLYEMWT